MATKKDLVEAYSFSRRRLVTAFVSGAPGGREVEPARPGRAVIGGIAIAVLLLAGAAVLNILGSPGDLDRDSEQLLSEKESGADYVLIGSPEGGGLKLRPVINITSAMLLLGSDTEPTVVPRDELSEFEAGEQIGILQAPTTPPPVSKLIGSGWSACTGRVGDESVGLRVNVAAATSVEPTPDVSFVVRSIGVDPDGPTPLYLISESARATDDGVPRAYAYEVPGDGDAVLGGVAASSSADAIDVPEDWLTTFPPGGALDLNTFGLNARDVGKPFPGPTPDGPLADVEIGDVLEIGEQSYLLTPQGEALPLDAFAKQVYLASLPDDREPIVAGASTLNDFDAAVSLQLDDARWPTEPTDKPPNGELCSLLRAEPGSAPSVVLARAIPGSDASAADVDLGQRLSTVEAGAGAFVRVGGWFDVTAPTRVLIDDRAFAYGVAGELEQVNLGYGGVEEEVIPDSWRKLFNEGVLLSTEAARCPPTSQARAEPCG